MANSSAQRIAKAKYQQEKCDRITADIPKGKRDAYKLIAATLGMSLAQLIQAAVEDYGRNHAGKDFLESLPTPEAKSLSPTDEKLLAEFSKLPPDAQKSLMQFLRTINQQVS